MKKPKENYPKIHIGKIIQEKVNKSGMSITEFAKKINLSRPAVYQMFNKQSIDCDLLARISLLLNENLFESLYKELEKSVLKDSEGFLVKEPEILYSNNQNIVNKLEHIHRDLISIKHILIDIKESKTPVQ